MRILVISQFFPPEMGAPAARFSDFGRLWVAAGHQVVVVTAFPNWPSGVVPPAYRGKLYQRETLDGMDVHRGYIYASARKNIITKSFGYISFVLSSSLILLLCRLRYDVVIGTSPPPLVGIPALLASALRRVPMVFDLRDLWPDSPAQIGMVKSRLLIRFLERFVMFIYRRASLITVVTKGKKGILTRDGVRSEKISVVTNGVDLGLRDTQARQPPPGDLDARLRTSQCFTYAGVLNTGQGLEIVFEAAAKLKDQAPEFYGRAAYFQPPGYLRLFQCSQFH
ncbi:MAG: glycosyltransferase family 4 protein, partial [bacterium]